jgi:CheY-like chemotaxis protein
MLRDTLPSLRSTTTYCGGDKVSGGETPAGEIAHVASRRGLVLIAEDEAPIAEALALIVEEAGYMPLTAAHGYQALELARVCRPALVITDLMMPQMDGVELIAALHADAAQDGRYPAPPMILMTAGVLRRGNEVGADAVLRKPFDLIELEALLLRFLGPPGGHPQHPPDPA